MANKGSLISEAGKLLASVSANNVVDGRLASGIEIHGEAFIHHDGTLSLTVYLTNEDQVEIDLCL